LRKLSASVTKSFAVVFRSPPIFRKSSPTLETSPGFAGSVSLIKSVPSLMKSPLVFWKSVSMLWKESASEGPSVNFIFSSLVTKSLRPSPNFRKSLSSLRKLALTLWKSPCARL
jgi:hypothetical protein